MAKINKPAAPTAITVVLAIGNGDNTAAFEALKGASYPLQVVVSNETNQNYSFPSAGIPFIAASDAVGVRFKNEKQALTLANDAVAFATIGRHATILEIRFEVIGAPEIAEKPPSTTEGA